MNSTQREALLKLAERINSISPRDFEASFDLSDLAVTVTSLKQYDMPLCTIEWLTMASPTNSYMLKEPIDTQNNWCIFQSADSCALYIQAKFSGGMKPHEHVWDLGIQAAVQPAYYVDCLVPGCPAKLTVPWLFPPNPPETP
jgi:hypothetical protein